MKILITGVGGFLGRHLSSALSKTGHEILGVSSKECDLTRADSLSLFDQIRFERIYHLAAWTQAGDFCLKHPGEQWLINQKINTHVLDWWVKKQPQAQMIAIGTSCSYDPHSELIESQYLSGVPIDSLFTYAMTKRMLLSGLIAIHRQFGLEYLYLIPSTLYGASYHKDGRQMHFIFDLIRKILRGVSHGDPVILWGDGEQRRELIHVEDFVNVSLLLVEKAKNTWVNIGSGQEYSIQHFASSICELTGYPFQKIQWDRSRYVGARSKVLNIEKLRSVIPEFTPRPLRKGLIEVIEWFSSKKDELRV